MQREKQRLELDALSLRCSNLSLSAENASLRTLESLGEAPLVPGVPQV